MPGAPTDCRTPCPSKLPGSLSHFWTFRNLEQSILFLMAFVAVIPRCSFLFILPTLNFMVDIFQHCFYSAAVLGSASLPGNAFISSWQITISMAERQDRNLIFKYQGSSRGERGKLTIQATSTTSRGKNQMNCRMPETMESRQSLCHTLLPTVIEVDIREFNLAGL